ncbi:hypothetical protein BC827DRAFT_1378551 [Russula dissimulans]|nr:hypothetical protein BC827DRAFT_1378551 [Russula dissimulans]
MGNRAVKKRQAERAAKKRAAAEEVSVSLAPPLPPSDSEKKVPPAPLPNTQKRSSRVASSTTRRKPFVTTEAAQTDPELAAKDTQVLQADDLSEVGSSTEDIPVLPERCSRKVFETMLARIVEDEAYDEEDRTIGGCTMGDEQWLEWKKGGLAPSPVDEYESDENDSDGTVTTMTAWSEALAPNQPASKPAMIDTDIDSSDEDLEPEENFQYLRKLISKSKQTRKTIPVSSTIEWVELQQKIASVLDVFPSNLQVQCVLPGDKSADPKFSLTSQEDLDDLHLELPWKRKYEEITISVTDKNDDKASMNAGKKGRGRLDLTSDSSTSDSLENLQGRKTTLREAIKAFWECKTHSYGERVIPCWRDGESQNCYVMTEHDIGFWAEILLDPHNNSVDKKPDHLNLLRNLHPASEKNVTVAAPNFGLLGNAMMPAYIAALQMQAALMAFQSQGHNLNAINPIHMQGILSTAPILAQPTGSRHPFHPAGPLPTPSNEQKVDLPTVPEWVLYCDNHPKRSKANLGDLCEKFTREGYLDIDQLSSACISPKDLAQSLEIGFGLASLIIRYADEDVASVHSGTLSLFATD